MAKCLESLRRRSSSSTHFPRVFALLVDQFGWQVSLYALFGCSLATWLAMELMSRWYEGARARSRLATGA